MSTEAASGSGPDRNAGVAAENTPAVETMSERSCWERLRRTSVGRLAIELDGQPEIFPINFVVDGTSIVFRTRPGTKLAGSTSLQRVAFEIDGYESPRGTAWSVVVKGRARAVDAIKEQADVGALPLLPWVTFAKPAFVRIVPIEVTGRRFELAHDVITDASFGWDRVTSFYADEHPSGRI